MNSKLRKPYNNESDDCVKLLYISAPHIYNYVFIGGELKIIKILEYLYKTNKINPIYKNMDLIASGTIIAEYEEGLKIPFIGFFSPGSTR